MASLLLWNELGPQFVIESVMAKQQLHILAFDIGGSGLKAVVLDQQACAVQQPKRVRTPQPASTQRVLDALVGMIVDLPPFDCVSVGFPGVVRAGTIYTAINLDPSWQGVCLQQQLQRLLGKPTRVANDADVQGLGCIHGHGMELVLTLGTGVGSALFYNGRLIPNLELGHNHFTKNCTYEQLLGKRAMRQHGHATWQKHLEQAIHDLQRVFNFDTLYLGGGHAMQ
ncbi:MAG: ROK family protein, partial [Myxococcota bacterium]